MLCVLVRVFRECTMCCFCFPSPPIDGASKRAPQGCMQPLNVGNVKVDVAWRMHVSKVFVAAARRSAMSAKSSRLFFWV